MPKIPLSKTSFVLIPEGTYVFQISNVEYDEDFGKLKIEMETEDDYKHTERFSLMNSNGEMNDKACNAFSYFAKTAMQDFSLEDIDPSDLIGCYIKAEVVHTVLPSNKDSSKTVTFANLGEKKAADGFTTKMKKPRAAENDTSALSENEQELDLDALLG